MQSVHQTATAKRVQGTRQYRRKARTYCPGNIANGNDVT